MQIRTKRRQGLGGRILFFAGIVLLLAVIIFHQHIASMLSGAVALVGAPQTVAYEGLPRSVLVARLQDAEQELSQIRYQALLYTHEVERNQELTALLNLPKQESYAYGSVLAGPPRTHYDTLLVSVASDEQVVVGDEVFAYGVIVGTVSEVRAGSVLVSLYSAPGATLDVRVGEPSAIAVMQGLGAGSFTFEVPKEVALAPGDVVLAAHADSVVAIVQNIVEEPERTTATVYAAAPVGTAAMRVLEFVRATPSVANEREE